MELGFNLNLEQKQKLVMTPQLQIAIELLQYSSHELEDYVDEELKNNPLLEKDENNKNELEKRILNQYSHNYQYNNSGNDDDYNYENFICYEPNLIEHLETQLFQVLDDDEIEIGRYIVGNLDEDGFLTLSVENISQNINETPEKINSVLRR